MHTIIAIVIILIAVILFLMTQMVITGRANKSSGRDPAIVREHLQYAHKLALFTGLLVLAIEAGVRLNGGSKHDALFWIHAGFALVYIVTLLLLFRYTGYMSNYHRWIAYTNLGSFLGVALLGVPMMLRRF
ncbi:MAG: hypothetical protein NVSMB66_1250 [Candidatus Doudnabacteria bacterium]